MTRPCSSRLQFTLGLVCLFGCDAVGRAVVGQRRHLPYPADECSFNRRCGDFTPAPPQQLPDAPTPYDLTLCPLAELGCADPSRQPAHGGSCSPPSDLQPMALGWSADALASRTCSAVVATHEAADEATDLTSRAVALRHANLRFESETPVSVELTNSELTQVSFELHGPIRLRLIDNRTLQDVRVTADADAQIEVEGASGVALAIEAERGRVSLRRVQLRRVRVHAQAIALESVDVKDGSFEVESFDATDSTCERLEVRADRSVLSACSVVSADFDACTAFTSVQGLLSNTHVAACVEPSHIYGSSVTSGRLDGALVLDRATVALSELGQPDAATLQLWDAELTDVTFCGDQQRLEFGGRSTVKCSHCDLAQQPLDVNACISSQGTLDVDSSDTCAGLSDARSCAPIDPQRMRPPLF